MHFAIPPISRRAALAAVLCASSGLCGCERKAPPDPHAGAPGSPEPLEQQGPQPTAPRAASFDPSAQKLAPPLEDAHRTIQAGHFPEARAQIERYLSNAAPNKRRGQAEFLIGLSYHKPELYEQAEPHFARAIELEPGYLATYYYRGFCLFHLGRIDAARKDFETYLGGDPGKPEALFGLALVALEQDRVDEAEALLERSIAATEPRLRPGRDGDDARADLSRYHARLSDVHLRRDDLARAKTALERSVELWPGHYEAWHKLHRVLSRLGDTDGAEKAWRTYETTYVRRFPGQKAAQR